MAWHDANISEFVEMWTQPPPPHQEPLEKLELEEAPRWRTKRSGFKLDTVWQLIAPASSRPGPGPSAGSGPGPGALEVQVPYMQLYALIWHGASGPGCCLCAVDVVFRSIGRKDLMLIKATGLHYLCVGAGPGWLEPRSHSGERLSLAVTLRDFRVCGRDAHVP